jgi:hypothetical protein
MNSSGNADNRVGGVVVTLTGSDYAKVMCLEPGSFLIAVSGVASSDGPSGCFSVSKYRTGEPATIVRLTGFRGKAGNEELELRWDENGAIMVGKTGVNHDGDYVVDLCCKHGSSFESPCSATYTAGLPIDP